MYLTRKAGVDYWIIDIETDGLNPSKIWVLVAENFRTREVLKLTNHADMKDFIENNNKAIFVGHNIISFDIAVINRLLGCRVPISRVVDTFLLSMVYSPSLNGGHSLEAWGQRLGYPKQEHNDWYQFSEEMVTRCVQDVVITFHTFERLTARMVQVGFTEDGIEIEHRAWAIIQRQKKNGFGFDRKKAHKLYVELRALEEQLKKEIYHFWPPQLQLIKEYSNPFKKNGEHSANYKRHLQQYPRVDLVEGRYRAFDYVEFDLASPNQRLAKLLELGWKPVEKTKSGKSWKVTDKGELVPSLVRFLEENPHEGALKLAEWITINGRANMIGTWLDSYNEETGKIHGSLFIANTLRYRHSGPNTANIPRIRTVGKDEDKRILLGREGAFTFESRDCWGTNNPSERNLVGIDAKGIQLRVLAHYLNNPKFTEAVIEGDPHEYNRALGDFRDRDTAKTFIYAFLLGAGDAKVGEIIRGSTKDGRETKLRFINNFPGLRQLLNSLEETLERTGRIILCDGTPILVPSPHMVLGYLLQGDESRLMKKAAILVGKEVRRERLDVLKVGDIHDEWQSDVLIPHTEPFIDICRKSFPEAGNHFNYRVPIECSSAVGKTWANTH